MLSFSLWLLSRLGGLAAISIVSGILYCLFRATFTSLRDIPGPFWARFSRIWYVKHINKGDQQFDEIALHKQHGAIVRLSPVQYSFDDPGAIRTIYDHGSKFRKSDFYAPFGAPLDPRTNIFQDPDIQSHAEKKKKLAAIYSMSSIASYEPFVESCMQTYLERLDEFAMKSEPVRLSRWMQYYAFDVIGAITVGHPFGFLTQGHDFPGIIAELRAGQVFGVHFGAFAGSWFKSFAKLMHTLGKKPPFQANQDYSHSNLARKKAELESGKITAETTGKQDFIEKLLARQAQDKVTDWDVLSSMRMNVSAGSDTTGISLSAVMYHLLRNPDAFQKLRAEVDEVKSRTTTSSDDFVTFTETQHMPYLNATIKEALRLHPAVGMQLPRLVPEPGATLAGQFFPAGTVVGTNPWVFHHNTAIFGSDAADFRPDRWLEDEKKARDMERCLLTFGAGARTCLGKNISLLEMQKLLPELVARYDFDLGGGEEEVSTLNRFFVYLEFDCVVRMRGEKAGEVS